MRKISYAKKIVQVSILEIFQGPYEIGSECFTGGSVQITDAVSIGAGSMNGIGSAVMSNIPANYIYMPKP